MASALLLSLAASSAAAQAPGAAERGAYLAAAAGCGQCHTDQQGGGKPYAGGRRLETVWGVVAAPNITPDRETGIGRWSFADFERALRWGVAPDDSHYLPAFPFIFYNGLADPDLRDLKAFLDSLPAVAQQNRRGEQGLLSISWAKAAVAVVAEPHDGPWRPDPDKDAEWNRGAYLAATIGRCGDCHTPRTVLGVRNPERTLAGAAAGGPGGKKVPNITPDPKVGIGDWSLEDIQTLLESGQTPDLDFVGGAMGEIVRNTGRLTDEDRRAIAVYLKSLPPHH